MLFIASLGSGGAERVMTEVANGLIDQGIEVHLVTLDSEVPDFYRTDARVIRHNPGAQTLGTSLMCRLSRNVALISWMRRILRQYRPDAVLSFIDRTNILVTVAGLGLGLKIVVSERVDPAADHVLPFGWRLVRPWIYRLSQRVVVQTTDVATWVKQHWKLDATVIPNVLRQMPPPRREREKLIVSIGRLVRQKGFDLSIEAYGRLHSKHPDWRYVILGDGPLRQELETLRNRLQLENVLSFEGLVTDVEAWLERATICVQPSRFEGFPNVVMEAMAMGVATVSSDCRSGPRDLIQNQSEGMLVPVEDIDALEASLDRLMSDTTLCRQLGDAAMSIRNRFARNRILELWITALDLKVGPA
jgi:GalNAc-alpha-(1->4)-GalNAc-alpha-(1->3)-diNAcBac-PP-undecaprenol alpha-1,4-N-acetyl-D-galactosaminyltransferase